MTLQLEGSERLELVPTGLDGKDHCLCLQIWGKNGDSAFLYMSESAWHRLRHALETPIAAVA